MLWYYQIAKAIIWFLLFLLTDWRVEGRGNVPRQGPLIVIANHLSLADPPILAVSLDRRLTFMAKRELFDSWFSGCIVRNLGAFPVNRMQLDRAAMRQAKEVLSRGLALAIFPEGQRSRDARLQTPYSGSALIALRNGAPVIPVGIVGTERIKGLAWILRRPKVIVNIGRPFSLPPVNGRLRKPELASLVDYMMSHIAELLPVENRGQYAGRLNGGHN